MRRTRVKESYVNGREERESHVNGREEKRVRNRPLEINWEELLASGADCPATIEIVKTEPLRSAANDSPAMEANEASLEQMPDHDLLERILSTKKTIAMALSFSDKGEKLRTSLQRLEDERGRRKLRRLETIQLEESDEFVKPTPPINPSGMGGSKYFRSENTTSQDPKDSSFASNFYKRMDEDTKKTRTSAFDREVSLLGPCNQRKMRNGRDSSKRKRHDDRSSSRRSPSKCHHNLSHEGGTRIFSNSNAKGRAFSTSSHMGENVANFYEKKKDPLPVSNSCDTRHRQGHTIFLEDEDEDEQEPQIIEILQQVEKPDESMKNVKIYYPSRQDAEAVEISYSDFDSLAPRAYLRSNIMNFYIRYLQQHVSPTNMVMRNCHFFNTYFYNKLKEVLSHKGNSRNEFFIKFRRWWKGVNNIFQKEYILIPINEDVHWSLVIICIPDREEQSGPIVLHLDSLGLHSRRSVFQNIKSFLIEEWNHLCQDFSCSDLPFADSIWETIPRRIIDNTIAVPQQRNDYDCGLFVLYFMQRFVEDAPGRLKKKDLSRFGKQWFKPEEASGLRLKINKLLIEEFKNAQMADNALEPSPTLPPPSSSPPPPLDEVVEV